MKSHDCSWDSQLVSLVEHQDALQASIDDAVRHGVEDHGATWADVGRLLGITRQAARQRFSGRVRS